MKLKQTRRLLVLLAIAAFIVCPSSLTSPLAAQKKQPAVKTGQVIQLRKIDQLKEAFQRDAGKVRFVTILSPT